MKLKSYKDEYLRNFEASKPIDNGMIEIVLTAAKHSLCILLIF